jgi:von Willebrand factor type A domain/Curli production assembly/transport component CsgG
MKTMHTRLLACVGTLILFLSCSQTIKTPEEINVGDVAPDTTADEAGAGHAPRHYAADDDDDDYEYDAEAPPPSPVPSSASPAEGLLESVASGGTSEKKSRARDEARFAGGADSSSRGGARPRRATLKASSSDDNAQFGYYLKFIKKNKSLRLPTLDVTSRSILQVLDSANEPLPNARVTLSLDGDEVWTGKTFANGQLLFHPRAYGLKKKARYDVEVEYNSVKAHTYLWGNQEQLAVAKVETLRLRQKKVPLDVVFILDTTGSMSDEISRLKDTLYEIHRQVTNLPVKADIRFGMVLYRDKGDEYVTRSFDFTGDVEKFQIELDKVTTGGGGDTPESMLPAISEALDELDWREDGIRLTFTVADAPPQFYKDEKDITPDKLAKKAAAQAIKLYMVGASGLDLIGEFVFRQLAQFTFARFLFLHYGEQGESDGATGGGRVSHHTGTNYQVSNLDALIVNIISEELSYFVPVSWDSYTPDSVKQDNEALAKQTKYIIEQLLVQIDQAGGPEPLRIAVAPVFAQDNRADPLSEYLSDLVAEQLVATGKAEVIDRSNLDRLIQEHRIQLSDLSDPAKAVEMGKLVGANVLLSSRLHVLGNNNILYLKAIAVDSSRVLGMARVRW